jgi:hypothetical protein
MKVGEKKDVEGANHISDGASVGTYVIDEDDFDDDQKLIDRK